MKRIPGCLECAQWTSPVPQPQVGETTCFSEEAQITDGSQSREGAEADSWVVQRRYQLDIATHRLDLSLDLGMGPWKQMDIHQ